MADRAAAAGVDFRPHFKTHQSTVVGNWVRDSGVTGITVTSPSMGAYFARDGWRDMTIAFPFYPGMIRELQELEQMTSLRLFVNNADQVQLINRDLQNRTKIYIEIDAGYGRSGVPANDRKSIEHLVKIISKGEKTEFHGFYIHDGGTYAARSENEIEEIIKPSADALIQLKSDFPEAKISLGDTPSASKSDRIKEMDEITPGNFVFYDWMQVNIGSCSLNDVALFAVLPAAQVIAGGIKAILHGGAVHLSKDTIQLNGKPTYGQAVKFNSDKIEVIEGAYLSALSQEHGTLTGYDKLQQDPVWVCPVHSCLTANLVSHYTTTDGQIIDKRILS